MVESRQLGDQIDVQMLFVLEMTVAQTRALRGLHSLEDVRAGGGFTGVPMTRLPQPRLSDDHLF